MKESFHSSSLKTSELTLFVLSVSEEHMLSVSSKLRNTVKVKFISSLIETVLYKIFSNQ